MIIPHLCSQSCPHILLVQGPEQDYIQVHKELSEVTPTWVGLGRATGLRIVGADCARELSEAPP